ncbi:hypothetical protein [Candidatus Mycoplasma mahonii]|uniref:hypothetical protein n=1 Tax=Candidatus Mycoplasma mahonii TaxID=3004105 RepID=UPI0026EF7BD9|nr:hypothetical protein [Candidatus Mycoplasma mahonii]WKX02180.1 hypothetical protein O3I44_02135 [Candidatus Mycoplasma mahonii]
MSVISIVLFVFAILRIDSRNELSVKLDNIGFFKKIQIVYLPHMKNNLILQLYIFIYESLFMYPTIFVDPFIVNGQTVMYYIVNQLQNASITQWNMAAAASILVLVYIIAIIAFTWCLRTIMNLYRYKRFKYEK